MTTKHELLVLLGAKEDAAKAELLETLEVICRLPGGDLDGLESDAGKLNGGSLYRKLSELYKRMPAYGELAGMVHGIWPDEPEPMPETQRAIGSDDGLDPKVVDEFFGEGTSDARAEDPEAL